MILNFSHYAIFLYTFCAKTIMIEKRKDFIFLKDAIKGFIADSVSGKRKMPSGKRISTGVISNYQYAMNLLVDFESYSGNCYRIIYLVKTNAAVLKRETRYWRVFFDEFSRFLYTEKKYYDHYISNTFKIIKTVFNYLKIEKAIPTGDFHKLFRIPFSQSVPVVLMPEQLHFLIRNENFHQSLSATLQRTKDILVFGCTTGLRISDLMNLKHCHVQQFNGFYNLQMFTKKTSSHVSIPLPDYCIDIIHKYHKKGHHVLPRLANSNINIQFKEICKKAGWTSPLPKYRTRKGKMVEIKSVHGKSFKFYEHISAHTMRRTAITTLLMMGVDEAVVRRISGHAAGSKEFYRYIAISQSYLDTQVIQAFQKLSENPSFYRTVNN
jgi:integrase